MLSRQLFANGQVSGIPSHSRIHSRKRALPLAVGSAIALLSGAVGSPRALAQPATLPTTDVSQAAVTQTAYSTGAQVASSSRIVLNLEMRRVYLYQNDMLVSSYPVAVGTTQTPTPTGQFTVSKMIVDPIWQSPWTGEITPPGPDSALGLRWIEFATSEEGAFGFHGTPTIESIGEAASNGCVRMRNEDVVALFSRVSVGTPVIIQ